jgi:4-amino-4-deoxy-L-arabinose transferase-like glycosyltransferase
VVADSRLPGAPAGAERPGAAVRPDPPRAWTFLLLALLSLPLYFLALGAHGLSDPDEPYYAVPALEMLRAGSWQVPLFHGRPWFDKPILFYWIVLACYRALGVSETAVRLGSALAAVGGLVTVYLLGLRSGLGERGARAAAVVLGTAVEYVLLARAAVTDMTLLLALALGMLAAAHCLQSGSALAAGLAGAAFGLATLTKGPVGVLVPGLALGSYSLLARSRDLLRPRLLAAGAAGLLLSAGPWYLYMSLRYPDLLGRTFLGEGNLGRFLNPEHQSFPLYYLVVLVLGLLPWSGALPFAVLSPCRRGLAAGETGLGRRPGPLFALCWAGSVLLLFSLSASKLPTYVFPAFPPLALLIAGYLEAACEAGRPPLAAASLGLALALSAGAGLPLLLARRGMGGAVVPAAAAGLVLSLGSGLAFIALRRRSLTGTLWAYGGAAGAAFLVLLLGAAPPLEAFDSTRPLIDRLRGLGMDAEVAGAYHVWDVSLDFYLRRDLPVVTDRADLIRRVGSAPDRVWIVRTRDLGVLAGDPVLSSNPVALGPRRSAVRLGLAPPGGAPSRGHAAPSDPPGRPA